MGASRPDGPSRGREQHAGVHGAGRFEDVDGPSTLISVSWTGESTESRTSIWAARWQISSGRVCVTIAASEPAVSGANDSPGHVVG